jgi:hypothetical protein
MIASLVQKVICVLEHTGDAVPFQAGKNVQAGSGTPPSLFVQWLLHRDQSSQSVKVTNHLQLT